jgi:hypothetical protein
LPLLALVPPVFRLLFSLLVLELAPKRVMAKKVGERDREQTCATPQASVEETGSGAI